MDDQACVSDEHVMSADESNHDDENSDDRDAIDDDDVQDCDEFSHITANRNMDSNSDSDMECLQDRYAKIEQSRKATRQANAKATASRKRRRIQTDSDSDDELTTTVAQEGPPDHRCDPAYPDSQIETQEFTHQVHSQFHTQPLVEEEGGPLDFPADEAAPRTGPSGGAAPGETFDSVFMQSDIDQDIVEELSDATLDAFTQDLKHRVDRALAGPDPVKAYKELYGLTAMDDNHVLPEQLQGAMTSNHIRGVMAFVNALTRSGKIGNQTQLTQSNRATMLHVLRTMKIGTSVLVNHVKQCRLRNGDTLRDLENELHPFDYNLPDATKQTSLQRLILFLLVKLFENDYRRYHTACFKQIRLARVRDQDNNTLYIDADEMENADEFTIVDVFATHAWKRVCSIEQCVRWAVDKDVDYDRWLDMTHASNNAKSAATYLESCYDHEFKPLVPNRKCRAFKNGILELEFRKQKFYSFFEHSSIPAKLVCCKYYDQEFDGNHLLYKHWYNIPTPALQSVIDYQHFSPVVAEVIYGQLGRLQYEVNEVDAWQVIFFIKGVAQSGKSTIGKVVQQFFQAEDIAVMASNIEQQFGLEAIVDKMLFICFEVTKKWSLARSDFQSLISGEELSISGKFKMARTTTWKVPGLLLGNEMGPWVDSAGSIVRRLLVCEFNERVEKSDPDLDNKLKAELPAVMYKCQQGYISQVNQFAGHGIWEKIPRYFRTIQSKISVCTNPIKDFLYNSYKLVRGDDYKMPLYVIQSYLKDFLTERKINMTFSVDQVLDVFKQEKIAVEQGIDEWDDKTFRGRFVIGITLRDKIGDNDQEDQEDQAEDPVEQANAQLEQETKEYYSQLPTEHAHVTVNTICTALAEVGWNVYTDGSSTHTLTRPPAEPESESDDPEAPEAPRLSRSPLPVVQPSTHPPVFQPPPPPVRVQTQLEMAHVLPTSIGFRTTDVRKTTNP